MSEAPTARIAIVGAGYVGLPLASMLGAGELGRHPQVTLLDRNPDRVAIDAVDGRKVEVSSDAAAWIHEEPDLAGVFLRAATEGRLTLRAYDPELEDLTEILDRLEVDRVYVCVGTPHCNGTIDTSAVEAVGLAVLETRHAALVIRSTITPDTLTRLREAYALLHEDAPTIPPARLAVVPEFLREGHAIEDLRHPTRVVVGTDSTELGAALFEELDTAFTNGHEAPLLQVSPAEASVVKLIANAALTVRALLGATIARAVSELPGGDLQRVLHAVTSGDARLAGLASVTPGLGAWGPCLPKDSAALCQMTGSPLLSIVRKANLGELYRLGEQVTGALRELEIDRPPKVGIIGCGFKPDSGDWRNGPLRELLTIVHDMRPDAVIVVWDDRATDEDMRTVAGDDGHTTHASRVLAGCDVVVLLRHPPYLPDEVETVIDPYALLSDEHVEHLGRNGIGYVGAGRGPGWSARENRPCIQTS